MSSELPENFLASLTGNEIVVLLHFVQHGLLETGAAEYAIRKVIERENGRNRSPKDLETMLRSAPVPGSPARI